MQTYHFTITGDESSLLDSTQHSYPLERGQTLFNNFLLHNIKTHSKCGGKALCGGCRIKILSGHEYCNKAITEEKIILNEQELKQGWRLSCQLYCLKEVSIFIPEKIGSSDID